MPLNTSMLYSPLVQGILSLVLMIPAILLTRPKNIDSVYTVAGIVYGIFILANVILYFPAEDVWRYFMFSMIATLAVMMGGYAIVSLAIRFVYKYPGSEESSMIFLIIMYHPPLLLFAMLLKWIFMK